MGAPNKGNAKGKAKKMTKTDCIRWIAKGQRSFGDSAHSSMNQTRKAKDDLVHLLRQVHHTEIR